MLDLFAYMKRLLSSYRWLRSVFFVVSVSLLPVPGYCDVGTQAISGVNIDHALTEGDYLDIRNYGFKFVRLSFPRKPLLSLKDPFDIDLSAFEVLDRNLVMAKRSGLQVLLDPHVFPGMQGLYTMKPSDPLWGNKDFEERIVSFWGYVAKRYATYGKTLYGYDLINEPSPPFVVNGIDRCAYLSGLYSRIVKEIRKYDSDRVLVVQFPFALNASGKSTNQMDGVGCLSPLPGNNLVYSFHMYDPGGFTHQGVGPFKSPVGFYSVKGEKGAIDYIESRLLPVKKWQERYGVPVVVGEFGASVMAGEQGDRYIKDVLNALGDKRWGWFFHSFREASVWNPEQPTHTGTNSKVGNVAYRIYHLSRHAMDPAAHSD